MNKRSSSRPMSISNASRRLIKAQELIDSVYLSVHEDLREELEEALLAAIDFTHNAITKCQVLRRTK